MATVGLLGTLDTKGVEYGYLRERVEEAGCDVILIDCGVVADPLITPDITHQEVAAAAGTDRAALAASGDRGAAVEAMAQGAGIVVGRLLAEGRIHAVLGIGGSGGSSLISAAIRELPIGFPKLIVSTMASGDTRPYVGSSDITMMHPVVDLAGINTISKRILGNAAAAAAGMAAAYEKSEPEHGRKPLIGATMFGVTTPCVTTAREWLEEHGYEVLVFHATGTGGRSMEGLMRGGSITGALDITTTELVDELVGGVLSAGRDRLETAGSLGLPQVVSLGALDMANFGPLETVPEEYRDRNLHRHNPNVTLMRTTPEEGARLGSIIATKLNRARGPVSLFIPNKGLSMLSTTGEVFHDSAADEALIFALKAGLEDSIEIIEMDTDINDASFAIAMARRMDELHRAWRNEQGRGSGTEAVQARHPAPRAHDMPN